MFTLEERMAMIETEVARLDNLMAQPSRFGRSTTFSCTSPRRSRELHYPGVEAVSDFDFEFQMVGMNARLNDQIEIVFLMASENHQFIASSLVKEIARLGGDFRSFVSPAWRICCWRGPKN